MILVCPHCNETLDVPMYAEHNASAYPEPVNVVTRCCGKMVTMKRVVSISVRVSDATVDGWGNKVGDQE